MQRDKDRTAFGQITSYRRTYNVCPESRIIDKSTKIQTLLFILLKTSDHVDDDDLKMTDL